MNLVVLNVVCVEVVGVYSCFGEGLYCFYDFVDECIYLYM